MGLVDVLVQNKWHSIAWSNNAKGKMASPDNRESNLNDNPNDTTTPWTISVVATFCLYIY